MSPVYLMITLVLLYGVTIDTALASVSMVNVVKRSMMTSGGALLSPRLKRWDYQTDGCHCSGFRIECPGDLFCKRKKRSPHWSCQIYCCGRRCVRK